MSNEEWGPNEWEHQERAPKKKEDESLTLVKVIIFLGFLPLIIIGFIWLMMSLF